MKQTIVIAFGLLITVSAFSQKGKSKVNGNAFQIGAYYLSPTRTQFDKYINTISTTLGLSSSFTPTNNIGGSFAFLMRTGKNEIEAGAGLAIGMRKKSSNAANTVTASLSNNTFDIHFGYNNYVGGPLFIGLDLGVVNNGGKLEQVGAPVNIFEDAPSSSNPFKGYVFTLKPKAGIFFPFKGGEYSGLKLSAFYDFGLSKYQFYSNDIFNIRLKNYTGAVKSSYKGFGVQATIAFTLDN